METIFGSCVVSRSTREIMLRGELQRVQRRTFDLIDYLLQHRTRVVTKDELLEKVWRNTELTDAAVARAIMKARKAIGDDPQQSFIRTVHGVGYRFVADVAVEPTERQEA